MSGSIWDFSGQTVVITGGERGIGRAAADQFCLAGADVVVLGRSAGRLEKAVAELESLGGGSATSVVGDFLDTDALHEAAAACIAKSNGKIDVLINNAGGGQFASLRDESPDELIDSTLGLNLRAVILFTRDLLPAIPVDGHASIINISSEAAKNARAGLTAYSASKAGVIGFTVALAKELAPAIRVNAICPGQVLTEMMTESLEQMSREQGISYEQICQEVVDPIPMGRFQEPGDIADAVLFLASQHARQITGEALNVSGGLVNW